MGRIEKTNERGATVTYEQRTRKAGSTLRTVETVMSFLHNDQAPILACPSEGVAHKYVTLFQERGCIAEARVNSKGNWYVRVKANKEGARARDVEDSK